MVDLDCYRHLFATFEIFLPLAPNYAGIGVVSTGGGLAAAGYNMVTIDASNMVHWVKDDVGVPEGWQRAAPWIPKKPRSAAPATAR